VAVVAGADVSGADLLVAVNAILNTLQVCFLAYIAARYQQKR
jgi:hypothetical protein